MEALYAYRLLASFVSDYVNDDFDLSQLTGDEPNPVAVHGTRADGEQLATLRDCLRVTGHESAAAKIDRILQLRTK